MNYAWYDGEGPTVNDGRSLQRLLLAELIIMIMLGTTYLTPATWR